MSRKIYEYAGKDLVVSWDLRRCIHVEECIHRSPTVFDRDRRPWIDADEAAADEVAEIVRHCPTGALQYTRTDGGAAETPPAANIVRVEANGPLYVEGRLTIRLPNGDSMEETRAALCRCGDSKNKPFCDNAHLEAGFEDAGGLGAAKLVQQEPEGPGLQIQPNPDGPIMVVGEVTLTAADGETQSGSKAFLCRCGASENKPYCDGRHKAIGFSAE